MAHSQIEHVRRSTQELVPQKAFDLGDGTFALALAVPEATLPAAVIGPGSPSISSYNCLSVGVSETDPTVYIEGIPGEQVWIYGLSLLCGDDESLIIKSTENGDVLIAYLNAGVGFVLPPAGNFAMPWYKLPTSAGMTFNSAAGETVAVLIMYGYINDPDYVPIFSVVIDGCDDEDCNGVYVFYTTKNGRPCFEGPEYELFWNSEAWVIGGDGYAQYFSTDDVPVPALITTWESEGADPPGPSVVAEIKPILVSGAGTEDVNGVYQFDSERDNRPMYIKEGGGQYIWRATDEWHIGTREEDQDSYKSTDGDVVLPNLAETWQATSGILPVPTFTVIDE